MSLVEIQLQNKNAVVAVKSARRLVAAARVKLAAAPLQTLPVPALNNVVSRKMVNVVVAVRKKNKLAHYFSSELNS
ncbi:hypothetical protein [Candidatus Mycoplasma haematominutum]|uniref:Uncharacterized protein n=1 Tax=Candidatus Mycoplasma haematominutum 'Birmingham 1' TaxID=1116213 RepID=G8C3T6_9MOLU|nr:hypothetical protein [Candidatus Mycoplasma haematominutum]CCE66984.1 hypothetical protein MHM_04660 [Candidatus Mycoplasma haematominutum 'Birmingham 1']